MEAEVEKKSGNGTPDPGRFATFTLPNFYLAGWLAGGEKWGGEPKDIKRGVMREAAWFVLWSHVMATTKLFSLANVIRWPLIVIYSTY